MCLSFNADRDTCGDKYADMCKKKTTFLDLFGKRFPLSRPQTSLNSYWDAINIPFSQFPLNFTQKIQKKGIQPIGVY